MFDPNPTVRGQELGEQLRALRDRSGLSLRDAAECMDASASKLSRIETGRKNAPVEDIGALLAIYDVRGAQRRELLALAREAERRGWWQRDRPTFPERQRTLISLESRADHIVTFETVVVPGLLQTSDYTRALMEESGLIAAEEIEDRLADRGRRGSVLARENPPDLLALIDELVLYRAIGGLKVLRGQLRRLAEIARRPNVRIHVVPSKTRGHSGLDGAFEVLRQPAGNSVVFLENLTSSLFLEEESEVATYRQAAESLFKRAFTEQQSVELLAALAQRRSPEDLGARSHDTEPDALAQEQLQYNSGKLRGSRS